MERTELDALVSFMLVHHPVPTLPVVCGRGEGSGYEEAIASSHGILANGIRFQMLHAENFMMATPDARHEAKEALLLQLQHDITAEACPHGDVSNSQLAACYALYSSAARAYQAVPHAHAGHGQCVPQQRGAQAGAVTRERAHVHVRGARGRATLDVRRAQPLRQAHSRLRRAAAHWAWYLRSARTSCAPS